MHYTPKPSDQNKKNKFNKTKINGWPIPSNH